MTRTVHPPTLARAPTGVVVVARPGVGHRLLNLTVLMAASSLPLRAVPVIPHARLVGGGPQLSSSQVTALTVKGVRLEAAAVIDAEPATNLKFDLFNTTQQRLTDIVVEISITDTSSTETALGTSHMLVRPFRMQGDLILEPGYSVGFEVLLRRLSADCECAANVRVVSVRFLLDEVTALSASDSAAF